MLTQLVLVLGPCWTRWGQRIAFIWGLNLGPRRTCMLRTCFELMLGIRCLWWANIGPFRAYVKIILDHTGAKWSSCGMIWGICWAHAEPKARFCLGLNLSLVDLSTSLLFPFFDLFDFFDFSTFRKRSSLFDFSTFRNWIHAHQTFRLLNLSKLDT